MTTISVLSVRFMFSKKDKTTIYPMLEKVVDVLNPLFSRQIKTSVEVNPFNQAEWQWVFTNPSSAWLYYRLLAQFIYPVNCYAAIGVAKQNDDVLFYEQAMEYSRNALDQSLSFDYPIALYHANYLEDGITNMLLQQWAQLKHQQAPVQSVVQFLYELQLPIYMLEKLQPRPWPRQQIQEIFMLKGTLFDQIKKLNGINTIDFSTAKTENWLELVQNIQVDKVYFSGLYQKGYATKIAQMLGMTRQNIDYHVQHGEIATERHLAAAIAIQLDREWHMM